MVSFNLFSNPFSTPFFQIKDKYHNKAQGFKVSKEEIPGQELLLPKSIDFKPVSSYIFFKKIGLW